MKTILIAIPTNKYIEPETFKSIYELEIPAGFVTTFQFFYGYQVDQVRNLIAHWAVNFDYLFSVDSDIILPKNALSRLLSHDKDIVSGLYIQRKLHEHTLELYRNGNNIPYAEIKGHGLIEVDSCGFGCVLVKSDVIKQIGYPQFVYKSAIDHKDTVSEDTYFCLKAKQLGYRVYGDTHVQCNHIGTYTHVVDSTPPQTPFERLMELSNTRLLPAAHLNYLHKLKNEGLEPKVIYDIGACVLHWAREAIGVWNNSQYFAFEAMPESAEIFQHFRIPYFIGALSDQDGKEITFYQNTTHPGGNSYYKENVEINKEADIYFNESHARKMITIKLDTVVENNKLPFPDLIKMDVQGAELDVLKGAEITLTHCKDLILELQRVEYNKGAPLREVVIDYLKTKGFVLVHGPFSDNGYDGDYHFTKIK